jgi:signal peptidase I
LEIIYLAAGRKSWEAAIPVYNAIVLLKIIGRPTWWTLLLFIPIINLIMFPVNLDEKTHKDTE